MSTPMTASDAVSNSIFGFIAASPVHGRQPVKASSDGGSSRSIPLAVIHTPARAGVRSVDSGARGDSSTAEASGMAATGLGGPLPWGSIRLQHRFPLPDLGMQREGSMRGHKGTWSLVLGSTSIGIA